MEAVLFTGIQATGKSTFFQDRFADTHLRISLDVLRTRHRERRLVEVCLGEQIPFVVDNTNPTRADRARYIGPAREADVPVIGYYFASSIADALQRNSKRARRVPERGVRGTHAKLELPELDEGFERLYYVRMDGPSGFTVEDWRDEV